MDRISRAGLAAFLGFALALVSGYAGAVAIPQGPDNVNLHASDGVNLTSRAAKWEFQQAADNLVAKGGFNVAGKGAAFAGNMVRNITRQQLLKGALGASRLLGGWGGAAALLAPIVWDALNQQWKVPDVAGPGEIQSLVPSGATAYGPPYSELPFWCDDFGSGWQGALSGNTWRWEIMSGSAPGSPWVYSRECGWRDTTKPHGKIYGYNVTRGTQAANCLAGTRAVLIIAGGLCGANGSGRPPTDQEFSDALNGGLNGNPAQAAPMAAWLTDHGAPIESGDPYTEGPPHADGKTETETQTSDAGTRTTTTTHGLDMTYAGQNVYVADTETQTVTDEAGNTTTKTTKHETTGGTDSSPPPTSTPDMCVDHPDASGCAPLGDVSDDPELPQQDYPVTFGYTSVTAACPAPKVVSFLGQEISWSFDGPCAFAQGVRPIVIAVALLAALFFVVKVGRG